MNWAPRPSLIRLAILLSDDVSPVGVPNCSPIRAVTQPSHSLCQRHWIPLQSDLLHEVRLKVHIGGAKGLHPALARTTASRQACFNSRSSHRLLITAFLHTAPFDLIYSRITCNRV
jgi:hypothetical protein